MAENMEPGGEWDSTSTSWTENVQLSTKMVGPTRAPNNNNNGIRPPSSSFGSTSSVILMASIGSVAFLALVSAVLLALFYRRKHKEREATIGPPGSAAVESSVSGKKGETASQFNLLETRKTATLGANPRHPARSATHGAIPKSSRPYHTETEAEAGAGGARIESDVTDTRAKNQQIMLRPDQTLSKESQGGNTTLTAPIRTDSTLKQQNTTLLFRQATGVGMTTFMNQATTVFVKQKELSIPGYIQVELNKDFTIDRELAKGGGGVVSLGKALNMEVIRRAGSATIVVKTIFIPPGKEDHVRTAFFQEVAVQWFLHEERNVAKLVGFCTEPCAILMKYYPLGTLHELIHEQLRKPALSNIFYGDRLVLELGADIARGLTAVHGAGLVHSDVKPLNVLLQNDKGSIVAAITDFGVARLVQDQALLVKAFEVSRLAGASLCYAAPELFSLAPVRAQDDPDSTLAQAADVFSVGVILAEMATRTPPWKGAQSAEEIKQGLLSGRRAYPPTLNLGRDLMHQKLLTLVQQCWQPAPGDRPKMHKVIEELTGIQAIAFGRTTVVN